MYLPVFKLETQTLSRIRADFSDPNVRIFGNFRANIQNQMKKYKWKWFLKWSIRLLHMRTVCITVHWLHQPKSFRDDASVCSCVWNVFWALLLNIISEMQFDCDTDACTGIRTCFKASNYVNSKIKVIINVCSWSRSRCQFSKSKKLFNRERKKQRWS